jgi:hypothetical protein
MNGLAVLCLQAIMLRSVECGKVVAVTWGHAVAKLVEALRYKPEGRGFDSRWCHNPSGCIIELGSTHPLTKMSTRNISWALKSAGE